MAETMTIREAAELWGVTERRVTGLCREGSIEGADKAGKSWVIPADAVKPADKRVRSGRYQKHDPRTALPLPIGISDYRKASSQYYYVDKTLMIRDFLDDRPMVSLFTRPRRFGKTLNMDMLRVFFEKTDEDTSVYFRNRKIWKCGRRYQEEQGKYPVIFLSFKDVKFDTWEATLQKMSELLSSEFSRHSELPDSGLCSEADKTVYRKVITRTAGSTELTGALAVLSRMLHAHHLIPPVIIIDEYDTPIQQGHTQNFYDQIIQFMRNLFSGGLKDNEHLSFGFLTGILRVAKESIFSGLNNLAINSILDEKYSEYFGFVPSEVREMAAYYRMADRMDEISDWYDGYRFGNSDIYNPWSVINYFRNGGRAAAYWQATGSNEIIGEALKSADRNTYEQLASLLRGESISALIDTSVIYPRIQTDPSSLYSFLLVAGYLKSTRTDCTFTGDCLCTVSIPNREIAFVYKKEILDRMDMLPPGIAVRIQEALYTGNVSALQELLRKLLLETASYHDTAGEAFYQGFVLGLCAMMDQRYQVTSNRESGNGRYDVQLFPRTPSLPGILIELKSASHASPGELESLSREALNQISSKAYETEMASRGICQILRYGAAFSGKQVCISIS